MPYEAVLHFNSAELRRKVFVRLLLGAGRLWLFPLPATFALATERKQPHEYSGKCSNVGRLLCRLPGASAQFENTTGITVTTALGPSQGDGPNTVGAQLRRGVPADLVILSREGLAELFAEGRIVIGSDVDLAEVPLGVGVRAGAPRPNIGTVDAFKEALLRAKSVGIRSGSGIYLTTKLFPNIGIATAMAGKLLIAGAANVVSGEVEMVVLPASEILSVPGVDFVGMIPAEIQFVPVFTAALVKEGKEPEASKRLIAFLASEKATSLIEKTGMKRPAPRRP
jgi:molybdate transport system substrate-binding protein